MYLKAFTEFKMKFPKGKLLYTITRTQRNSVEYHWVNSFIFRRGVKDTHYAEIHDDMVIVYYDPEIPVETTIKNIIEKCKQNTKEWIKTEKMLPPPDQLN